MPSKIGAAHHTDLTRRAEWAYPLSWRVPAESLPRESWVLISRPRAQVLSRLRDAVGVLERRDVDEIVAGLNELIGDR